MPDNKQWYTNKDLFEQINSLSKEMQVTRNIIKKYNGLREKLGQVEEKVNHIESLTKGKQSIGLAIREWGGWIFALITLAILIYRG